MIYYLIFLFSVLIASVSQIMLKKSTDIIYDKWWKEYLNTKTIVSYALFFVSTLLTMYAYKGVTVSMGAVLEASGYIFVTFMSVIYLKEKVGKTKGIGIILILIGIFIANFL